ncbi:MAG TPA: DegT/DnrJ/EryC1/StrS family aminotransferase, partial [Ktedonobacterales bacterium]|nr:DegT/DnrJ/EryC1/StrS family aminotransferase [Ktedonobacterales bacterium]
GLLLPAKITGGATPVPVTLGGQPLPWPTLGAIYDACHGPYTWQPGATAMCFSFHPAKHIAAGEGGMIVCDDAVLAARLRMLRDSGRGFAGPPKFWVQPGGTNGWMDEMSCALAASQLTRLEAGIARRRTIADLYDKGLWHVCEVVDHAPGSARHLYQILIENRDTTQQRLATLGIGTQLHYSPIIPNQPAAVAFGWKSGQFPGAEEFAARALTLPLFPSMTEADVEQVLAALHEVLP